MATKSGTPAASERVPGQQRAYEGGNVRPADERFLTDAQADADAAYAEEVAIAVAEAEAQARPEQERTDVDDLTDKVSADVAAAVRTELEKD